MNERRKNLVLSEGVKRLSLQDFAGQTFIPLDILTRRTDWVDLIHLVGFKNKLLRSVITIRPITDNLFTISLKKLIIDKAKDKR